MTTTACDDQLAPDPSSREAAIDAMVMEVQPHEWRQGGAMRYQGYLITWGEYVQARNREQEAWHQAQDDLADAWDAGEERMDAIGANGPTGDHYAEDSDGESALSQALSMPSKYHVRLKGSWCDVYDVLQAFGVSNPADQHAIKKMLMPGKRGHKGSIQDRREAIQSLQRAIELEGDA